MYYRKTKSGPLGIKITIYLKVSAEGKVLQTISLKNIYRIDENMQTFYKTIYNLNKKMARIVILTEHHQQDYVT